MYVSGKPNINDGGQAGGRVEIYVADKVMSKNLRKSPLFSEVDAVSGVMTKSWSSVHEASTCSRLHVRRLVCSVSK